MSDRPIRIQRKRTRGWRMPPNTRCVTRPGKFGNPFTGDGAARIHREWLQTHPEGQKVAAMARKELRGLNLACFCGLDQECHADNLLEISNSEDSK